MSFAPLGRRHMIFSNRTFAARLALPALVSRQLRTVQLVVSRSRRSFIRLVERASAFRQQTRLRAPYANGQPHSVIKHASVHSSSVMPVSNTSAGLRAWQYSTPWSTHPWRCSFGSSPEPGSSLPTCANDLPATTSLTHDTVTLLRFGSHFFSVPFFGAPPS